MPDEPLISNVSDTARWVAAYRAMESARPDALFHDPLANRLAGERGRAIAGMRSRTMRSGWPMVVRTQLIDELVTDSIQNGCDRVLNLAAGLDTRPYRMDLPESLDWIEADLAPMIDEKEKLLAGEKPRCRLRREGVDLASRDARTAFLSAALNGAKKALVLTEGLLVYLDAGVVEAIARDLHADPAIAWWILDLNSPAIRRMLMKESGGLLLENAPMKFAPPEGIAFYEKLGWRASDVRSFVREGLRLRRLPLLLSLLARLPEPNPRDLGEHARWSAVLRLTRA